MTSWLGFDSTTPRVIPSGVFVSPYYNGDYAWHTSDLGRFDSGRAMIDVYADAWSACSVLQVDGTPAQKARLTELAPQWCANRESFRPDTATVYCNRSDLPALALAFDNARVAAPWIWLATLDGTACLDGVPGGWGKLAAVQGWGEAQLGFHADASLILSADWYSHHGGRP